MTLNKIQHILTGLKGEIAREKDRNRLIVLARMGLFYNRVMLSKPETQICLSCKELLPINCFQFIITSYVRKDGSVRCHSYYNCRCKRCVAESVGALKNDRRKAKKALKLSCG